MISLLMVLYGAALRLGQETEEIGRSGLGRMIKALLKEKYEYEEAIPVARRDDDDGDKGCDTDSDADQDADFETHYMEASLVEVDLRDVVRELAEVDPQVETFGAGSENAERTILE